MLSWIVFGVFSISASAADAKKQCYSLDSQPLGDVYQPCNPDAEFSSCCALNGTSGQNDICMTGGLCMSTSGWFSTYLYANGCTDPTGKDKSCPQQCSFMPSGYSWNVLPCNANNGTFCCRAGSDDANCCETPSRVFQADTTIGQVLLPGTDQVVNTTYSTINPSTSKDNSGVVGGVLGGVLGVLLLVTLILLFMVFRSRRNLRRDYGALQHDRDTLAQQGADEKMMLQRELEQQRLQQQQYQAQMQTPMYQQYAPVFYQPSPALPGAPSDHGYANEVSGHTRPYEMDSMRGASELSEETAPLKPEKISEQPKSSH